MLFLIVREINDIANSKIFPRRCVALVSLGVLRLRLIAVVADRLRSHDASILLKAYV